MDPHDPSSSEHDYVVVGGGSAGCVVAGRLAEDSSASVLLLDAGIRSRSPLLRVPGGMAEVIGNPRFDWLYQSEPDASRGGRRTSWSAGRVLGGGSAINGLVFSRGLARDYDAWAAAGCPGWSAAEVLPYFERLEHFERPGFAHRGRDGPLGVEFNRYRPAVLERYLEACRELGMPVVADINGFPFEGVGRGQASSWRGVRQSSALAWLGSPRRNLEIRSEARATALTFEGQRCTGVRHQRGGATQWARARRATVVCGGTFGSAQLLMLSGIGPPELLRRHGIEVVQPLPGVGRNLQDHPAVFEMLRVRLPTLVASDRTWGAPWHALRWLLRGDGPAGGAAMIASGYLRSEQAEPEPDLYLQLAAFAMQPNPAGRLRFTSEPAITTIMSIARPHGRGTLEITSADPLVPLRGALELLGDERDRRRLVAALRLVRRIHGAPALQREAAAGSRSPQAGESGQSEEDLLAQVVATAGAQYHPVGSCRMGSDELAVVDPHLRVRGIAGLHVADASIMPRLTSGNTNAPVLMIAERAVDFIRQGPAERVQSVSIAQGAETLACP